MTAEEKRAALTKYCTGKDCLECTLRPFCWEHNLIGYTHVQDELVDKAYLTLIELKGEPTMNEHETQTTLEATIDGTIVITRAEYAYLIAKSTKADLLEDYVNNREYLDKDVVRAILGMHRSEESEG